MVLGVALILASVLAIVAWRLVGRVARIERTATALVVFFDGPDRSPDTGERAAGGDATGAR
jgi:hypothetical protein